MKNTRVGWMVWICCFFISFFTNLAFADFAEIEEELRYALLEGHVEQLVANNITADDLLNLKIIEKPVEFYGLSPEFTYNNVTTNALTSYFKKIDFNSTYLPELAGNIQNFIAVIKNEPFVVCDILIKDNAYKLVGFRRTKNGLDISHIVKSEDNHFFLTPNTIFTKSKNGYSLTRCSSF